jgi:triphosphatase
MKTLVRRTDQLIRQRRLGVERRGWRNEIDSEALPVRSLPILTLANRSCIARRFKRGAHFR